MTTRRLFGRLALAAAACPFSGAASETASKPGRLQDDIPAAAQWMSAALRSSGYNADFSPMSIAEVERFFAEQTKDGTAVPGSLLSEHVGQRLFGLGSYCGEVLRKELGGQWLTDDSDPAGELNAALRLRDGSTCWPMQRVLGRFQSSDANLVVWADFIRRGGKPPSS
jgi:hypothetical protein